MSPSFPALLQRELARRVSRGESRWTVSAIKYSVGQFVRWLAEAVQVTEAGQFQPEHIEQWLLWLRTRRLRTGLPLTPFAIAGSIDRVKSFCQQLVKAGVIGARILDSFGNIRRPQLLPKPTPSHVEIRGILRAMPVDTPKRQMVRTIAEVLYTSAMRPCELLALDVGDLDLERGLAKVMGKGRRERMVPLGKTATRMLESYIQAVRPLFLREQGERAVWLTSMTGRRLSYATLKAALHRSVPGETCGRITCYTFRRACATELIRSGASVWAVKELLGHDDLEKLKHYVQLTINDLKKTHARCHPRDKIGTG